MTKKPSKHQLMEMEINAMGIKRNTNVSSYLEDDEDLVDQDVLEEDDEDEVPERSSVVQVGWDAAKKVANNANKGYATDFRPTEEVQLIKFVSSEPMIFSQHWVQRQGKKSFVCPESVSCPLCRAGNTPEKKFAFSVVNLSGDDDSLTVQLMTVGVRLFTQLAKLNEDPKTGPLHRLYWAISKSGQGTKTSYSIMPVKDRDLAEDWDIDPEEASKAIKPLKPLTTDVLRPSSMDDLKQIAREMPED